MKHIQTFESFLSESIGNPFRNTEVVDDAGNPVVVYHYTNKEFDKFDLGKARSSGYSNLGFWFGSDADKSKIYGRLKKACYLDIENGYYVEEWDDFIRAVETYSKTFGNEADEFRDYLQEKGYDGVIISNADIDDVGPQTIYVVFGNDQIQCIK